MNQMLSNTREVKISSLSSSFNLPFDVSMIDIQVHLDIKPFKITKYCLLKISGHKLNSSIISNEQEIK